VEHNSLHSWEEAVFDTESNPSILSSVRPSAGPLTGGMESEGKTVDKK
jgi:hypothetical protein